ncbi:MAG: NAD-dependent epimerase/dehydratase family protein, partial [Gemmatimonadota bacterium]|nr:NAD-dependent epimerase/dehydratase family protein [Gemmatimonadota bacterium]
MPRALVTGATGMVGSHLCARLIADGWSVRAMVRDEPRARWLGDMGAELAIGDVLDVSAFTRAARGCDAIYHTAAMIVGPSGGWEHYRKLNVDGTRHAVDAAAASGARLLQMSSCAVYGEGARYSERPTDESTPLLPLDDSSFYARSKRESEQLVLEAHDRGEIWATAVRPDVIYGERDRQFVPRMAKLFRRLGAPVIGGGRNTLALVHAANVADGAVRAARSDIAGGRAYNLANDYDLTWNDFVRLAGEGMGRRVRRIPIPEALARGVVAVGIKIMSVAAGGEAAPTGGALPFLTRDNPFTSERAKREIGWSPPVRHEQACPAHSAGGASTTE